jgi:hypothetical protein
MAVAGSLAVAGCEGDAAPAATPAPEMPSDTLEPGEVCETTTPPPVSLRFDPPTLVVARGATRAVRVIAEPDVCVTKDVTFAVSGGAVVEAPAPGRLTLRRPEHDLLVVGAQPGTATVTATVRRRVVTDPSSKLDEHEVPFEDRRAASKEETFEAQLPIEVLEPTVPRCASGEGSSDTLSASRPTIHGAGALASASLGALPLAYTREDEFRLESFAASIGCADDLTAVDPRKAPNEIDPGTERIALGPAVSFGVAASGPVSMNKPLRRELSFSIPANPALMPAFARLRHLEVLFQSPMAKTPRVIPVTDPHFEKEGEGYVFKFASPWLGTYQVTVARNAGTVHRQRRLAHRAMLGISMGASGVAAIGLRHHRRFDTLVPLGGPSEWSWLLHFIDDYLVSGFCPQGKNCEKVPPNGYPLDEPFAHSMDFNHWYSQDGRGGNSFSRHTYVDLFSDLSAMLGNPNGGNADPSIAHFAPGPKATDPWVTGTVPGVDCRLTVSPVSSAADKEQQDKIERDCFASRCRPENAWKAPSGYFDDEYNPDGSLPVISFCDGRGGGGPAPYLASWNGPSSGQPVPVSFAVAVDLNHNGLREENEPVIRSAHEPYDDTGIDGLSDENEPGYDAAQNPDPAQDDYDPHLNPNGTERNGRFDPGEPYRDYGLDGVPGTRLRHVAGDPGEGDGKFTETPGLSAFYELDSRSLLQRRALAVPDGPLDDDAIRRLNFMTDGGVRDLFNFAAVARHLQGALVSRRDEGGRGLLSTAYYSGYDLLPGQVPGRPEKFEPSAMRWRDIVGAPSVRYGTLDATPEVVALGDGMHVGSDDQILQRVQTGFFFIGEQWKDADRRMTEATSDRAATTTKSELGLACEVEGRCFTEFTGPKSKRTGPVSIILPPGYAHAANVLSDRRYPVVYLLHGYGQEPKDIEGLGVLSNVFMNDHKRSAATRLPKVIMVAVDGRCRMGADGKPECVQGSFYFNSTRQDGPQFDTWIDEIVDFIDKNYRTMPASTVDVVE